VHFLLIIPEEVLNASKGFIFATAQAVPFLADPVSWTNVAPQTQLR
jgi:hypothetical protein